MYKKDRENLIKKLSNLNLKELIEPTYTYKEHKKKTFIKVLEAIIEKENDYAYDNACDRCGVYEDDLVLANKLHDIVKAIKNNCYGEDLFRSKNPNKVEIV
jgi:ABC-type Na+ transport system ATPase subunit NatA